MNSPELSLSNLIAAALILLTSFAVGIVLLCMSFSRWIFVLLSFCRFWLNFQIETSLHSDRKALQQTVMQEIKDRKKVLAKFWFLILALLLFPLLIVYAAIGLKTAESTAIFGSQAIRLPESVDLFLLPVAAVLGVCLTTVSLVAMPVAAMSNEGAWQTMKETLNFCAKNFPKAAGLAVVILFLNTLIASPHLLTKYAYLEAYLMPSGNLVQAVLIQVWQGLVSVILFPLSLIPFCELLRPSIGNIVRIGE